MKNVITCAALLLLGWVAVALAQGVAGLTTTDGTNTVTNTTKQSFGACFLVGGSAGAATINPLVPNNTSAISYTIAAVDMCGQRNFYNTGLTATIPAISGTVLAAGMSVTVFNEYPTATLAVSSTPVINGLPTSGSGPYTLTLPPYGGMTCVSNGTTLDCIGVGVLTNGALLNAKQTWSAQQSGSVTTLTISTVTYTPDGSNNDYYLHLTSACASAACTLANYGTVPPAGTHGLLEIQQPASGGPASFGTYGSQYKSPGGTATIALSSAASAIDVIGYFSDGTSVYLIPSYAYAH